MHQPARKNINGPVRQKNVSRLLRCKKDLAELPVKAKLAFCPLSSTVSHSDSLSLYFSVPLPRCSFTPFLFYVVTHKICRYWRNALSLPLVFLSRLSVLRRSRLCVYFSPYLCQWPIYWQTEMPFFDVWQTDSTSASSVSIFLCHLTLLCLFISYLLSSQLIVIFEV